MFIVLLLSWMLLMVRGDELEDFDRMMAPKDKSRWVDPLDMGLASSPAPDSCLATEASLIKTEQALSNCKQKLELMTRASNTTSPPPTRKAETTPRAPCKEVFLRRYVSHLLARLSLVGSNSGAHLRLEVLLTAHQVKVLQNFASSDFDKVPATDIDQILSSFIKNVDTYENSPWLDNLKEQFSSLRDPLLVLVLLLSLLYTVSIVLRSMRTFYVVILLIAVCVSWHWLHMFKVAWAGKHAKLLQSGDVPPECRPHEMTWMQTLQSSGRSMFTMVDRCEDYHKNIMVDPIYEVNPMMAMVDLSSNLVFHPLKSFGHNVGGMFSGLMESVPILWRPVILILFVLLLMFILILISGYKISLPLFLGEIGPARQVNSELQEVKKLLEVQSERLLQLDHVRKMSAPVTSLEYRRPQVEEVGFLQLQGDVGGASGDGGHLRRRGVGQVLSRSVSQVDVVKTRINGNYNKNEDHNIVGKDNEYITDSIASSEKDLSTEGIDEITDHDGASKLDVPVSTVSTTCSDTKDAKDMVASLTDPTNLDEPRTPVKYSKLTEAACTPLPRTPLKSLLVAVGERSPRDTKFQWVTAERGVDDTCVGNKEEPKKDKTDFLDKVEEVFYPPSQNVEVDC